MSHQSRHQSLEAVGLLHPRPEAVSAELFCSGGPFFFSLDKVQVKYEMLRAHFVEGDTVTQAAAAHGYSRAGFYLVGESFAESGMIGLLDESRGRKGPTKLTEEVVAFLRDAPVGVSAPMLAEQVAARFGIDLHRRTIERARRR